MYAGSNGVEGIGAQVLGAEADDGLLIREETDNLRRPQLTDDDRENAVDHTGGNGHMQRLQGALVLAGTRVLSSNGGDGGEHRGRNQEQEADDLFYDADRGGHIHAAAVGNGSDDQEGDLNQAVLAGHRNADLQNPGEHLSVRLQVLQLQHGRSGLCASGTQSIFQKEQSQQYTQRLCDDCREGGAHRPHGEGADQNIVQDDIDDTGGEDENHRALRVTQSAEDAADHVVGGDEGNADKADQNVLPGLCEGLRRRGQNAQNRIPRENEQDGDHY